MIFDFSRFLYPGILALIVSSVSFPLGLGQFCAGHIGTHQQVMELFSNFTWTKDDLSVEELTVVNNWSTPYTNVFFSLVGYLAFTVRDDF